MLHILLLILKIIGIILAAILGILVLLVCIVLFVPVRYEVSGKCEGNIDSLKAKIKVTWLLHLVRVDAYFKNRKLRWRLRFAWMKRMGGQDYTLSEEEQIPVTETKTPVAKNKEENAYEEKEPEEKLAETQEELPETEDAQEWKESVEEIPEKESSDRKEDKESITSKIKGLIEKIKCTITKLCDKIKALSEKKNKLTAFVQDEVHVQAFCKVKKEVFHLLGHLKPDKIQANIVFGFDDPCTTGQVLAVFSMLYPFIGEHTNIVPDFEHQILKGNLHIKGKIRVCHFVAVCIRLILCKNIRTTYRHVKNFEL